MRSVSLDFLHRRGENTHFKLKTRVPEPFWTFERSLLCTGAVKTHFVHRRGGFAKRCKSVKLSSEITRLQNRQKHTRKRQVYAGIGALLARFSRYFSVSGPAGRRRPKTSTRALLRHPPGPLPDSSRTPPGPLPDPSRTPPGRLPDASRTPPGRSRTDSVWLGSCSDSSSDHPTNSRIDSDCFDNCPDPS